MSLRPRYSLLTLLVLTALVAGGLMFYRLPRRAIVSDSPTPEEQKHLAEHQIDANFASNYDETLGSLILEYEYLSTWSGQEWRSVVGRPRGKNFLVAVQNRNLGSNNDWSFWSESYFDTHPASFLPGTRYERVQVMVMACLSPREAIPYSSDDDTSGNDRTKPVSAIDYLTSGRRRGELYLLTDQQHIFQITWTHEMLGGNSLTLEQIPNAAVRQRVAEELKKLPALTKSP